MNRQYFLDFILKDKEGRQVFMTFLKQRHCAENLMFWVDAERYSQIDDFDMERRKKAAQAIYHKFISSDSAYEINVNGAMKSAIVSQLNEPTQDLFLPAQKAIFLLMVYGSFDYFLNTEQEFYQKSKGNTSEDDADSLSDEEDKKSKKKKNRKKRGGGHSTRMEDKKCILS